MAKPDIQYLQRHEMNIQKWDSCINAASNGLIYAYSNYLDKMSTHWDGIVVNDYEAVFPLTWRKKYGFYYLYPPYLTAQLGLFGNHINQELFEAVIQSIPKKFRYWDYNFNHQNIYSVDGFTFQKRINFILDLQKPYEELKRNYRESTTRNIKKSREYGNKLQKNIPISEVADVVLENGLLTNEGELNRFMELFQLLHKENKAITYGIYNSTDQLMSSASFLFSHNRAYYILVGNHPNGRTLGASHALIDHFICDHAGKKLLLDFEGSDIRNLAFFYSSFGATEEYYPSIKRNLLPAYLRWLKN
jgi:hypothetical protein